MSEEQDDTIYYQITEEEYKSLHGSLATAMQSVEWVAEEIGAVMHKGKSGTAALLAIKAIVDKYEAGMHVVEERSLDGEVVLRYVVRP